MQPDRPRIRRVAFDIGGTFTDVMVLFEDGSFDTLKILSMLDRVGNDIRDHLQSRGGRAGGFVHGTTVATNAILEDKLPRVALLTTKGFRDVLEMRTQRRPSVYDVNWKRPRSLVQREHVYEIAERIDSAGNVTIALDRAQAAAQIEAIKASGAHAVGICLINSYRNPEHEKALEAWLEQAIPALPVSASYRDFAEIREYERTSTTMVNAALRPIVDDYLTRLEKQLGVTDRDLQVMQSNGGLIDSSTARRRPVTIIESGPAAGVMAAARIAREAGIAQALAFDMGGTTAKATLILDGKPLEKPSGEVGSGLNVASSRFYGGWGHAVQVPTLDIAEVSAGGGSIAWVDSGGALRVGPEGAGAQPGPACYGRGGMHPTVTDANVVLGYINPQGLAGQTIAIDRDAAAAAIDREIAKPLGLSLLEAAAGIVRVANATTMRALRAVSIERGIDPRGVSIIAFGGAGPIHAAQLGEVLGVAAVVLPPFPGIFSAVGLLLAEFRYDAVRSFVTSLDRLDRRGMDAIFAELRKDVQTAMAAQSAKSAAILRDYVDVRYKGQEKSLTLEFAASTDSAATGEQIGAEFTAAHFSLFGYRRNDPLEIVALRVRGMAGVDDISMADIARSQGSASASASSRRPVCFDPRIGMVEIQTMPRSALQAKIDGPLIVEERDTSIVVPPGWSARADELRNVILERKSESQG